MEIQKKKFNFKRFFNLYLSRFLISGVAITLIFISIYVPREMTLIAALDGTFYGTVIAGILVFGSIATNMGFFDIIAYNAVRISKRFYGGKKDSAKSDFYGTYDYTKSKEEKRKDMRYVFLSYFAVFVIYLVTTLILYSLYLN